MRVKLYRMSIECIGTVMSCEELSLMKVGWE